MGYSEAFFQTFFVIELGFLFAHILHNVNTHFPLKSANLFTNCSPYEIENVTLDLFIYA